MKTKLFTVLLLICSWNIEAQVKFITKTGHIWFFSHTPIEDIEAHNKNVVSSLNITTGEIQFVLLMKSFKFEKALMEEHFNENYAESDQFPKATFKGKIINLTDINILSGQLQNVKIEGDLLIHGKTNKIQAKGTLTYKDGQIIGISKFSISPPDYNIKIEKHLEEQIAKNIEINVEMGYIKTE
jgi:polyisoprenoid-binding protein YceI